MSDQLLTFDPPVHTAHRALLMRLITPKRLRENEEFMWRLADRQIDEFVDRGDCEFIGDVRPAVRHARRRRPARRAGARPRAVPRAARCRVTRARPAPWAAPATRRSRTTRSSSSTNSSPRTSRTAVASPRDDVLTGMATATFPDGSIPEAIDVARIAANLFAAGQETTVRLFGSGAPAHRRRPRAPAAAARTP